MTSYYDWAAKLNRRDSATTHDVIDIGDYLVTEHIDWNNADYTWPSERLLVLSRMFRAHFAVELR